MHTTPDFNHLPLHIFDEIIFLVTISHITEAASPMLCGA